MAELENVRSGSQCVGIAGAMAPTCAPCNVPPWECRQLVPSAIGDGPSNEYRYIMVYSDGRFTIQVVDPSTFATRAYNVPRQSWMPKEYGPMDT